MRNAMLIVVGLVITAAGVVWALQGFDIVGGSFMTGNHTYEVVGPVVAVVGLAVVVIGLRRLRSASR
jgi:hypothetical protein